MILFGTEPNGTNVWAIQYGTSMIYNDTVEYRDGTPHATWKMLI
jgi:hypothetical protein